MPPNDEAFYAFSNPFPFRHLTFLNPLHIAPAFVQTIQIEKVHQRLLLQTRQELYFQHVQTHELLLPFV